MPAGTSIEDLIIFSVILMLPLALTFWAIKDIPTRRFSSRRKKIIWFAVVSTLPFLGAMFYVIFERRHTTESTKTP